MGVRIGVFGDINIQLHRDHVEKLCGKEAEPIWPLWEQEREKTLDEFLSAGFVATVVATKANLLGENWLGRNIDKRFIEDLGKHQDVDLCGELGEYHSLITDWPIFKKRIKILENSKKLKTYTVAGVKEDHWLLDISKYEVCEKERAQSCPHFSR